MNEKPRYRYFPGIPGIIAPGWLLQTDKSGPWRPRWAFPFYLPCAGVERGPAPLIRLVRKGLA